MYYLFITKEKDIEKYISKRLKKGTISGLEIVPFFLGL